MQTPERTPSPPPAHGHGLGSDDFADFPAPPSLALPAGTYTLLPLVDKADNGEIPRGPWQAADLEKRWHQHVAQSLASDSTDPTAPGEDGLDSSAVDDSDHEEDEESSGPRFDREFIVPFFVQVPEDSRPRPAATATPRRRSSSTRSASFTPMTPIPSLRPSSPTASHPGFVKTRSNLAAAQPVGFLRPPIVLALLEDNQRLINMNLRPVWKFFPRVSFEKIERRPSYGSRPGSRRHSIKSLTPKPEVSSPTTAPAPGESASPSGGKDEDGLAFSEVVNSLRNLELGRSGRTGIWAVGFEDWINESIEAFELRNEHLDRVVRGWKMGGQFLDQLAGWRNEEYNIYGPGPKFSAEDNPLPGSNVAFRLERAACSLFGVTTFGVHATAYVEEEGQELKIWVPRRSATKATWPSFLDNTVAGGITAGDLPRQSILREFSEEASLAPEVVSPLLRQTGVVTYVFRQAHGWLQPEVQYVYEMKLPSDASVKPTTNPNDGEVETFELMGLGQVVQRLVDGEFKPNCALVLIDFFIRHGLLTAENDVRFLEVSGRIHRELGLPGPV